MARAKARSMRRSEPNPHCRATVSMGALVEIRVRRAWSMRTRSTKAAGLVSNSLRKSRLSVRGARPAVLRRTLARLERVRARISRSRSRFGADAITHAELALAADESIHAARKALAGQRYLAWREKPARLDARARRSLGRELASLAEQQRALAARLRALWLVRSRPSNFEITGRRLARSIASLRRAAQALERDRPPAPPPPHEGFSTAAVFAELKRSASLA